MKGAPRQGLLMAALLLAWGTASILWGERLPRADGFGWDGTLYRSVTERLWEPNPEVWAYTGRRCLPAVAVHCTLRALGLPLDGPHILTAFAVYNLLLLLVMLAALLAACGEMGIGPRGRWLMFLGVFCNYVHLKQHYYSACVTDVWAQTCCAVALLAYLKRSGAGVLAASAVGAFTWPLLFPFGALLFLFPRRPALESYNPDTAPADPRRRHLVVARLVTGVALCGMALLVCRGEFFGVVPRAALLRHGSPQAFLSEVIVPLLPLSVACAGLYLYFGLAGLLNDRRLFDLRAGLTRRALARVGVLAAVYLGIQVGYLQLRYLFPRPGEVMNAAHFLELVLISGVAKPLLFLVAHAAWYGPLILAAALLWKRVCREAQRYGAGLVLTLAFGLLLALNPESRQTLMVFPALALLTVKVLEARPWGFGRLAAFAVLALALSRAWLPLDIVPWPEEDRIAEFPMQLFFMNFGGYMTRAGYAILGTATLGAIGVLAAVIFWRPGATAKVEQTSARRAAA